MCVCVRVRVQAYMADVRTRMYALVHMNIYDMKTLYRFVHCVCVSKFLLFIHVWVMEIFSYMALPLFNFMDRQCNITTIS